jgi:hypothetical protein
MSLLRGLRSATLRLLPTLPNHSPPPTSPVPADQGADDRIIKAGYPSQRPMDEVSFQHRLSGVLGPVLSLGVLDPLTEEPYLELYELFMECNENQRARIRAGWPYEREWRIPVPEQRTIGPAEKSLNGECGHVWSLTQSSRQSPTRATSWLGSQSSTGRRISWE